MNAAGRVRYSLARHAIGWAWIGLLPLTGLASDHDFGAVAGSLEQGYHLHRKSVPWIGMASFCAHIATGGAVKGIQIAEFDRKAQLPRSADVPAVVQSALGASWSLIVASSSRGTGSHEDGEDREQTAIYARPHGARMTLLVASFDREAMSVVRLDMNAAQFAKWLEKPGAHLHPEETD